MLDHLALALDAALLAFALGATVWFFFVQSPALLRWMGKERFLPVQMRLTRVLFTALAVAVPAMLVAAVIHGHELLWQHIATAGLATLAALGGALVVVPRALRAGGASLRDLRKDGGSDSVAEFASVGGGRASRTLHRMVVGVVLVMLAGLLGHGALLMSGSAAHRALSPSPAHAQDAHHADKKESHAHGEGHGALRLNGKAKWHANAETTQGVRKMKAIVDEALAAPLDEAQTRAVAKRLHGAFQDIFRQCTMTGQAHDQLHVYLSPMAGPLGELETAKAADAPALLAKLSAHLKMYDDYFVTPTKAH